MRARSPYAFDEPRRDRLGIALAVLGVVSSLALSSWALSSWAVPAPPAVHAPAVTQPPAEPPSDALVLEADSVARGQLVGLGRDVVVRGRALADVVALNGTIRVSGQVEGDVIALGGDVALAPTARVTGDVFTLGGRLDAEPGAEIGGRAVSYPTASSAWLTLLEGPTLGLPATSPVVLAAKLGLLAAWLVLVLVFFAASGREVLSTSNSVAEEPFRDFVVGLVGVVTLVLTALLLATLAGALVGVPMLVLVVVLALVLKLWGMVAVFHALGAWLARRPMFSKHRPEHRSRHIAPLHAATLGLLVLGVCKFIPYVGVWAWTAATLIGVGAALSTKLGRREPWFQAAV